MSLDPLASVEDLEGRLGRALSDDEADRAELLLADASATVRSYTGQQFTAATNDTARLRSRSGIVILPQRPVTAVGGVEDTDGNTIDFTWYDGDRFTLTNVTVCWVDVTYDHGYDEIPEDIIAVVCQIAGRAMGTPSDQTGLSSESIGTYSYSVGAAAAAGTAGLLNDERTILDRYRRVGGVARLAF